MAAICAAYWPIALGILAVGAIVYLGYKGY